MPEIEALNGTVRVDRNEDGEVFLHVYQNTMSRDETILFGSQVRMKPGDATEVAKALRRQVQLILLGQHWRIG